MLHTVYASLGLCCTEGNAILGVNSESSHPEMESNDETLYSAMMVQLWTGMREMENEDKDDMEDTSRCEKLQVPFV
jgi:hypothetical protein